MVNTLFITGIKHCGKSTLGKLLSDKLNLSFFDLDELIETNTEMKVRELFTKYGKEKFQHEEALAVEKLFKEKDSFVCATGGGICDNPEAFKLICQKGINIYIDQEWEVLYSRIAKGGIPPFLKTDNPKAEFKELYIRRSQLYKNNADIIINAGDKTPLEVYEELNMILKEKNYAR